MNIAVVWIGKTRPVWARAATDEYLSRLAAFRRLAAVEGLELSGRDPEAALLRHAKDGRLWLLDPAGKTLDSSQFQRFVAREAGANRELILAVGGADGFSPAVRAAAAGRISLSPLTLSHALARVALLEQVYRALAAMAGHPYPH
jgi:23S rRNA (pseudouridine1915-N3)-methyltransferase